MNSGTVSTEQFQQRRSKLIERSTTEPIKPMDIRCRRTYTGHLTKIFSGQWLSNSSGFISAAQDGKLIFWDAHLGTKNRFVLLKSPFVMSCGVSDDGNVVCVGGLENVCHIYKKESTCESTNGSKGSAQNKHSTITDRELVTEYKLALSLIGHSGYISGCKFLNSNKAQVVTSSGDHSAIIWDINSGKKVQVFPNLHTRDISSLSIARKKELFLTGSFDGSCCLVDPRVDGKSVINFRHDSAEINCVAFGNSEDYFITGSSDSTCKLYDIRWNQSFLTSISAVPNSEEVGCVSLSHSGRYLFCSGESPQLVIWDILEGTKLATHSGHTNRISFMELSPNGYALLTGSWDADLRLWTNYA